MTDAWRAAVQQPKLRPRRKKQKGRSVSMASDGRDHLALRQRDQNRRLV